MRVFLCTTFAGNPEGRNIDMAGVAMILYNVVVPQIAEVLIGDGSNAKSALAVLRSNVLGKHHAFVSSEVLQRPDEFRKQGKHFASCRALTLQENHAGEPWIEDLVKRFIGGEFIACRALFGKVTELYFWRMALKVLEWNRTFPSIRGDWRNIMSLRSFWRRLIVIEMASVFTGDHSQINIAGRVFGEKDLSEFLESPLARLIYFRTYLIPFIQRHSAEDCRAMLKNPSQRITDATLRVVVQMANGGLELPEEWHFP